MCDMIPWPKRRRIIDDDTPLPYDLLAVARKKGQRLPIAYPNATIGSKRRGYCMRIAIVGTGGIGAPLGASLATAGPDGVFLARAAQLTAMRAHA
jgi:hypothetical protein